MIREFFNRKAAAHLAKLGAEQRRRAAQDRASADREKVRAVAREIRRKLGLADDPRLA